MSASIIASTKMPCRGECGKSYQKLDLYMLMCRACFRKAYQNNDLYFPAHFVNIVRTLEEALTDECSRLKPSRCFCNKSWEFMFLDKEDAEKTGLSMYLYDTYSSMYRKSWNQYFEKAMQETYKAGRELKELEDAKKASKKVSK